MSRMTRKQYSRPELTQVPAQAVLAVWLGLCELLAERRQKDLVSLTRYIRLANDILDNMVWLVSQTQAEGEP